MEKIALCAPRVYSRQIALLILCVITGIKKRYKSLFVKLCSVVPYGLKLSNFIEDFNKIRKLKAFMEIKQLA